MRNYRPGCPLLGTDRSEMLQEVYRRDRQNGRTHKIRHVSGNNEIAARSLRRDRDDRVVKVAQRQLAGTLKIRLVHRVNRKISEQSVQRLVGQSCPGIFFENIMKRGQGVSWQHGGEFSPADAMHDFLGRVLVGQTILRHVQQDIQIHRHFHRCFAARCSRWSVRASKSAGTAPVNFKFSG